MDEVQYLRTVQYSSVGVHLGSGSSNDYRNEQQLRLRLSLTTVGRWWPMWSAGRSHDSGNCSHKHTTEQT